MTRVLIVEDNPINQKLLRVTLAAEGWDVAVAEDAEQALAVIERTPPAVILMDLQLPGIDGLQLTRLVKARSELACVVIAVTAYAMKGDRQRAREAGCDGYLTKPIDTRTIAESIRTVMAGQHLGWEDV